MEEKMGLTDGYDDSSNNSIAESQESLPADGESNPSVTAFAASKQDRIRLACKERDVDALVELATTTGGFVTDELRCLAWPLLLGSPVDVSSEDPAWDSLPTHRDEGQVKLDVDRSFIYYPREPDAKLDKRKVELHDLIVQTLRRSPELSYFQGYHDIVQVLLLVLGKSAARVPVARLSMLRIRDFMLPTMSASVAHLHLLRPILRTADPKLERHLSTTQPFFALPATLTLYAHDIQEYGDIARLFDLLLAWEASMSIYLFATIILSRKNELLEIEPDEPEMLHSILSKLPKPLDLEKLISDAVGLFRAHPPNKLPTFTWTSISSYSVLKTTRNREHLLQQTLEDGQELFRKHTAQIAFRQRVSNARLALWKMRKPTGAIGVAVLVAVLSWWWRHDSGWTWIHPVWEYFHGLVRRI